MAFKKAFEKLKDQKDRVVQKLPKPVRRKADDKLGLFIHKYVATLFYFDDEIQEIYWEMEEAVQEGEREKASQLSAEMKTLIVMRSDKDSGISTREHRQAVSKATDKIQKATEALKGKNKAAAVKDFIRLGDEEDLEDADLSEDIDEMIEEVDN
jgi:hypothetical protein